MGLYGVVVVSGTEFGLEECSEFESRQIRPKKASRPQVLDEVSGAEVKPADGAGTGAVIDAVFSDVFRSRHPQNHPGFEQ